MLLNSIVKQTGRESGRAEIFHFFQSKSANNVCKMLQLLGTSSLDPTGDFRLPDALNYTPKWKFLALLLVTDSRSEKFTILNESIIDCLWTVRQPAGLWWIWRTIAGTSNFSATLHHHQEGGSKLGSGRYLGFACGNLKSANFGHAQ